MLGMSRTLSGERMVAFEFLRIETRPDGIFYVAQPRGNPPTPSARFLVPGATTARFLSPNSTLRELQTRSLLR